jgi:excisionase family DNA binding protein
VADARSALFVRLPAAQARRLDAHARTLGRTKQDYVSDLLATSLEGLPPGRAEEQVAAEADTVLTMGELAQLLKLDEPAVMERVAAGHIPGRRFGEQWRFSHRAVLGWLDGSDADQTAPGFRVDR